MRILCDACEAAPARVFCAADEAALCVICDVKVHGCNKLASRHVRLILTETHTIPPCDICENAPAFFFCEIDGTSLCLECDMDVHVGGKKMHQRYLIMRQRVELPAKQPEEDWGTQSATDQQRLHGKMPQQLHDFSHYECVQERGVDSDTSAVAMAVGDSDLPSPAEHLTSKSLDLNYQPPHHP